jgi:hypothetical protein
VNSQLSSNLLSGVTVMNRERRTRTKRIALVTVTLIAGVLLSVVSANAATKTSNAGAVNWNTAGSWSPSGVPANGDAVVIPSGSTVTLDTNTNSLLSLSVTGTLTIGNNNTNRTITVTGTVTVNSGGTFQTAGNGGNALIVGGNLANAGTFDAVIGSASMDTTFNGSANQTLSGGGGTTDFNLINVNNTGAANNNIVEVTSTNFTVPAGFLTLTDGIFKVSGSFTLTNTFFAAAGYTINADEGIWLNNANATVTAQNSDMNLNGLLRVSLGTYNVGTAADDCLVYGTGSTIDIQGGALNIAGGLRGNTVSALGTTNTTTYSQSGGTVTTAIVNVASNITAGGESYGSFDIHAPGSSFTMSAGTIVLQNPTNVPNDYVVGGTLGSVTGGTVQFGNASTTIGNVYLMTSTTPIFNLTIKATTSPSSGITINPLTVKGVVTIDAGAVFNAQSLGLTVAGNWVNNGTFNPGTQTTTFNGTSGAQTISGSSATGFSSLTVSNGAGLGLSSVDATVNAVLSLNSGDITTGANFLNMAVGATSTGTPAPGTDVVGNVRRTHTFTTGTTYAFGNQFVSLIFTAAGTKPTAMNINLVKSVPTGANFGFSTAVQRTYTVTPTGGTGYSATLRLHYLNSELNGNNENSANFDLWRHNGVNTWQRQVKTANNAADTANWVEKSGVTQFSAWTIAGGSTSPSGPTSVSLTRFNAASFSDGVLLNWESGFEVNNLGYHVYREQNGRRTRVTPSIVAGSALTVGPGNRLTAGYSYSWFDPEGTPGSVYSLEAIDLGGSSEWAGPIYPVAGSNGSKSGRAPRYDRAMLLNEIAAEGGDWRTVSSWPAAMKQASETKISLTENGARHGEWIRSTGQSGALPTHFTEGLNSNQAEASLAIQQAIAAGKAVKIQVRKSGWYRVTQAELVAAGFDPSSDARMLQLYVDGEEVPISLSTEGVRLNTRDTLEFYGVALDTPTTDKRVYWLVSGSSSGKRIPARLSKLKPIDPYSEIVSGSFDLTIERSEKLIYFSNLLNGDAENIFGSLVSSEFVNQTLVARNVDRESISQPLLEVALQGLTAGDHAVQLQLNGTNLGTVSFTSREHSLAKFPVASALLREGDNLVSLVSVNGSDISLIDWVRLTYPHQYKAENNTLRFSALGGQPVKIEGFTSPNVQVVDVTDPNSPMPLSAYAAAAGSSSSYSVRVHPSGNGVRILMAFTADLSEHPASITANRPSTWNAAANGADLVIITHKDFSQAIEPLASLRRTQGLSVAVVDVEDLYDEFTYGVHTPAAIKSFLMNAAANWSRKPAYLLLVGDSSWDPRNYLGQGDNDFVPTKLIDTLNMETGSDDWLADFDDVGFANMAVGRLPARTAADASLMVSKILSYEQERGLNAPLRGAVMVADTGFEPQNSQTVALMPAGMTVQTINRADVGNDDAMRGQVVDAINQGPMVVNYYGHGSVRVWTSAGLLDSNLAANLTNANRLSLFVMMTCLNGYANDAYLDSLSEAAMKAPNGGAVAVWASSGFTPPEPQFEMNTEFYRLLFGSEPMRLGDAVKNAKAVTPDPDVRRTWILLGDPAMRVR